MKKNVASQRIGAQLVSATDGSAFTGSVTVSVCGDAGTQATGSVGSGACTHEGNGYHTYAPSQAETNFDLIAFTFTGTGAVPVTVQVYTRPTTGLLAPTVDGRTLDVSAGGEAGIDLANVGSPTTTLNLSGTTISTSQTVASVSGAVGSVTGSVGSVVGAVGSVTAGVTVATIGSGVITAASIAASALDGKGNWNVGKTGYALTQAFPTNFSSLAITAGGSVTVGTNSDKTGYSLTQSFPSNFASMAISVSGAVTVGTNSDKSGYSLATAPPTAAEILTALGTGTWLTAIPWNQNWDAEVQSECNDALIALGVFRSGDTITHTRSGKTDVTETVTRV